MKSRFFTIVTQILMLSVFFLSITPAFSAIPPAYNAEELTNRLKTGAYLQKTDNLMIIVDGLGETFLGVGEPQSQKIARFLISNIGKTIPNIPHRRLLRAFGPKADRFEKDFSTVFGLYHIDAKGFTPIITTKTLAISDFDPLGLTFISATKDLRKLSGTHAVVLISDGVNIPKSAIYESAYMKKKFGGSVCYYPILVGNDPQGTKNMSTIAKIGGCGVLAQYEAVDSPAELNDYVEKIFFAKRRVPVKPAVVKQPVAEDMQQPLGQEPVAPVMTDTPEVTEIIEQPAIPDIIEDEYGKKAPVIDDNIIILERQLPHDKVVTIELHVEFDLNKASLRTGYEEEIKKVADFMLLYPETEALLEGHTCDLGSAAYNQELSNRRANTVKNYLVKNFGIRPDRLNTRGAGESEPIASNATEEGRMKNRRVMAVISTIVTDYVVVEQEILKSDFLRDDFILPPVDQLVDELMQQEVVEEPQEVEIPESSEDAGGSGDSSMTPEGAPEMTAPASTEGAVDVPAQTTEEEVPVEAVDDVQIEKETSAPAEVLIPTTEETETTVDTPAEKAVSPAMTSEEVVAVPPGESAFDDERAPMEASPPEEVGTETVSPALEEPVLEEEPKKVNADDDSYL
jgi:OOP family OmpA-OmpF porin